MDVETRARDALNEVHREQYPDRPANLWSSEKRGEWIALEAACRLIEQQDAFARGVSDAVKEAINQPFPSHATIQAIFSRFILPEPVDPLLIEARAICSEAMGVDYTSETTETRGALLATYNALRRGLELANAGGEAGR